jgi:hypothetical protein
MTSPSRPIWTKDAPMSRIQRSASRVTKPVCPMTTRRSRPEVARARRSVLTPYPPRACHEPVADPGVPLRRSSAPARRWLTPRGARHRASVVLGDRAGRLLRSGDGSHVRPMLVQCATAGVVDASNRI